MYLCIRFQNKVRIIIFDFVLRVFLQMRHTAIM